MGRAYRVIVQDLAEADVADAAGWYERQREGLGGEFLVEVRKVIAAAAANPFLYACVRAKPEVRRAQTKRFPYRVYFVRREGKIVVFRVLHGARDEREWQARVPGR